ncbi:adenine phosphoribosyltransferase-like [Octopus vulgaris]|uniref:Adenine phosphoribosyltransferase-like n=2 Tax=Octopus TaxID=6643 RepID=A0AA36FGH5_OCTVU|nr:adenine phosphoribosyltransferase [Octopus sinensis]XP_029647498.1 adenine phosphoribosyltransferase [Octopus sinensis]XP_036366746.1 adenine phosphoribosyltransferase [Octopus sinensis]XP_036366747.1 adenine phosphoribosyltransferase [Octopus sinensis]CAI9737690.1 adenine phosphoribosyltransferase-like [Octopus vulgaris]
METEEDERVVKIKEVLKYFPDFPKKGVNFCDVLPILQNPPVFKGLISKMVEIVKEHAPDVELIVGLEARGFLFGPLIANELNVGFVPIRKKGKLPGPTYSVNYKLEYGEDSFEVQTTAVKSGQKVVIVDDLLATGGTLEAAVKLMTREKAIVQMCLVVIKAKEFIGKLTDIQVPVNSIIEM